MQTTKNPPKRVFPRTIPTSCRPPPRRWSIILDPGELPVHHLMDPILCVAHRVGNSQVPRSRVSLSLYPANSIRRVWVAGKYFGVRKILHLAGLSTAKNAGNKKPAEAGLYQDHSNSLSAAFPAMVDRP
ncbi:hypothetical protein ALQ59_100670 [Pseudomonas syringae pv. apii]|uniref:Uncharacterized protein n=1 Tax=Pseudomonas syringae pv. apii TaxID=81036 RepID=A0A3M3MSK2_9PSED|nr:hypothetical protein ALQ59_100670 [Pseudomonas syringae pv. apii]RMN52648.1 hypothetical protein ALQ58_100574 [Pseudomonas syringae pv. apii]RMN95932.1 hypothetical protein ALQ49_100450 [Pseudomonas syringae pv. apii]